MKKIIRKIMSLLSEKQRHSIYRKMATLPAEYFNPSFQVEIARTRQDLEEAYTLLHDCYVGTKIIDRQPSGLRCNLFSFLPTSTIIVAKLDGKVVGTVSAIKDSSSGLPSDKEFLAENDKFRRRGMTLTEASALAVAPQFRGNHSVSFLLMKYLYNYCRDGFKADFMVGAVHPRSEDFYKALWHFERNGDVVQYNSLKGAAAIHISMNLSKEHFQKVIEDFGPENPKVNLGSMIVADDDRFHYPQWKSGQSIHPVITPDMLKYFCLQKKEVWSRMSLEDKRKLVDVYTTFFGAETMLDFREDHFSVQPQIEYRTPIQLLSVISLSDRSRFCQVLDLTTGGCYIGWAGEMPKQGENLKISFRFSGRNYVLNGQVVWKNDNQCLHRRRGFGVQFSTKQPALSLNLQEWLYDSAVMTTAEVHQASA